MTGMGKMLCEDDNVQFAFDALGIVVQTSNSIDTIMKIFESTNEQNPL